MSKSPLQAFAGASSGLLAADETGRIRLRSPERVGETTKQVADRSFALPRQASCRADLRGDRHERSPKPGPGLSRNAELGAEASERAKLAVTSEPFEEALGCSTRA
jgi:hypothetical protein